MWYVPLQLMVTLGDWMNFKAILQDRPFFLTLIMRTMVIRQTPTMFSDVKQSALALPIAVFHSTRISLPGIILTKTLMMIMTRRL